MLEFDSNDAEGAKERSKALPSQSHRAAAFEARDHRLVDARACFEVRLCDEGAEPDLPNGGAHGAPGHLLRSGGSGIGSGGSGIGIARPLTPLRLPLGTSRGWNG